MAKGYEFMIDINKQPIKVGDNLIDKWGQSGVVIKPFGRLEWKTSLGVYVLSSSLILAFELRKVRK